MYQLSGVRCQVSGYSCQVLCVTCHLSTVNYQITGITLTVLQVPKFYQILSDYLITSLLHKCLTNPVQPPPKVCHPIGLSFPPPVFLQP